MSIKIDLQQIGERDGWRCGICGKPVDKSLKRPDPRSATLHHIIPLADGGTHTEQNVQLVHTACHNALHAPQKPFLSFIVDSALLARIDDFRFRWRFESRAAAIRWLLLWALGKDPKPDD